jgi:hypothetical protein
MAWIRKSVMKVKKKVATAAKMKRLMFMEDGNA